MNTLQFLEHLILPPFLFPPKGKGLLLTPSPVGEGWVGVLKL